MKTFALALCLGLLTAPTHARARTAFSTPDPCLQAAIAETYRDFPLHKKTSARFFEWNSSTSSNWQSFTDIENLGPDYGKYVSIEEVAKQINTNLFKASEAGRKIALLQSIQGKKVLFMQFRFADSCSLLRYFTVEQEAEGSCEVKHIDTQIDDFDNG